MSWRNYLRRNQADREWREEMEAHIAMATDEFLAQGLTAEEARLAALKQAGNLIARREEIYQMNGIGWLDSLWSDLRYALRGLRRHPSFTAAVLLTLALGIGANTAIFGVIDSILIRPLAYPHSEALVGLWHTAPGFQSFGQNLNCTPSMYFTYRDENRTFEQFGVWESNGASVTGIAEPELPRALVVTYGVLNALGVQPLLGRWFSRDDDTPGTAETVILTYGYWQRRFGGDKSIMGRTLTINSKPRTVIGVMPEDFRFVRDPELILPQRFERNKVNLGEFGYNGIARLKPGVTLAEANADVSRMLGIWLNGWPPPPGFDRAIFQNARVTPRIQPLKQEVVGDVGKALWVVMGTLGLVLLIACANVANLLLVRSEDRQQELAIRAALGAGWGRIARAMLLESMTLSVIGGALGLGLAYAALRVLVMKGPDTLPRLREIGIDPGVLAFAFGVSLLSGALFGVIPVLKYTGPQVATALRGVGRTFSQGRERHRARNLLVVVQVALALVLLISSGLMIRTFQQLRNVKPGFTGPEEIQILHSMAPASIANQPERVMRMWNQIADKLAAIPGVKSVGFADTAPMETFLTPNNPIYAEDKPYAKGQVPPVRRFRMIAPGFFKTMGTRMIVGRDFTWTDLYERRHVAIVSENLAREMWGDARAALGKRIRVGTIDAWREVVGVVEDVYDDGMQVKPPKFAYWPALMDGWLFGDEHGFVTGFGMFAIRSDRTATEGLLKEAQQIIWSVNGRQPVFLVSTLKELYDQSMARTSFTLVMLALAGGMALGLGIVGIYGVIAYAVSQRTREIGIRMAMGAPPAVLLRVFVRQGLLLAGVGAALGLAAAAGLTRLMSSLLFGVKALDPLTYAAVSALLIFAAVLASYIPARRAMAIDPVEALRAE
ncbi:MAG TPA: ABC transporter permease [Bryobacteraceae bacterium]|nr:ABC transporter permease [Bryobacteraceae bacterium]